MRKAHRDALEEHERGPQARIHVARKIQSVNRVDPEWDAREEGGVLAEEARLGRVRVDHVELLAPQDAPELDERPKVLERRVPTGHRDCDVTDATLLDGRHVRPRRRDACDVEPGVLQRLQLMEQKHSERDVARGDVGDAGARGRATRLHGSTLTIARLGGPGGSAGAGMNAPRRGRI